MKLLVTGGSGMIGMALQRTANHNIESIFVSSFHGDLRNKDECTDIFNEVKPTHVIHLAADVGGIKKNLTKSAQLFHDNMMINLNVIDSCMKLGVEKLINIMSTCCYSDDCPCPFSEDNVHFGVPHHNNLGFGFAKRMSELQCALYNAQYSTKFISCILTNSFGPYDNFDLESSHVIGAVVRKISDALSNNTPPVFWSDGQAVRQFSYADDIAQCLWWILLNYNSTETLNVGSSETVKIIDLVKIVCNHMNYDFNKVHWDSSQPQGQKIKISDMSKFNSIFPFQFRSLEQGIRDTVDWFKANSFERE